MIVTGSNHRSKKMTKKGNARNGKESENLVLLTATALGPAPRPRHHHHHPRVHTVPRHHHPCVQLSSSTRRTPATLLTAASGEGSSRGAAIAVVVNFLNQAPLRLVVYTCCHESARSLLLVDTRLHCCIAVFAPSSVALRRDSWGRHFCSQQQHLKLHLQRDYWLHHAV